MPSTAAKAAAILARAGDRASAKLLIKWAFELAELAGYRGFELMEIASAETLAGKPKPPGKHLSGPGDGRPGGHESEYRPRCPGEGG